jgi:hypothetical protein
MIDGISAQNLTISATQQGAMTPQEQAQVAALLNGLNEIEGNIYPPEGSESGGNWVVWEQGFQDTLTALDNLGEAKLYALTGGKLGEAQFMQLKNELVYGLANQSTVFPPEGGFTAEISTTLNTFLSVLNQL